MNDQLKALMTMVEAQGLRLSRDWTAKLPVHGTIHGYSVVQTEPGDRKSPFMTAIIMEYEGSGYELFLPGTGNSISADVPRLLGE